MKRIILLAVLAGCLSQLCVAERPADSLSRNNKPVYLQLYAGINKSANENLPWIELLACGVAL